MLRAGSVVDVIIYSSVTFLHLKTPSMRRGGQITRPPPQINKRVCLVERADAAVAGTRAEVRRYRRVFRHATFFSVVASVAS